MQLAFLQNLQEMASPVLDLLFLALTMLGDKTVLAGIFLLIYWCQDKEWGRYLIYALSLTTCVNGVVKDFFQAARPIGEAGIRSRLVSSATGHSFPSGHSQSAATFWWACALWLKTRWSKILSILLILCVGLSRLYLGLHYPADVIVGIVLGMLVSTLLHMYLKRRKSYRIPAVICIVLALFSLYTGSSEDTVAAGMLALCVLAGHWFESRFAPLQKVRTFFHGIGRLAIGGLVCGICLVASRLLLPGGLYWSAVPVGLVAFAGMGLCPWLFLKLKL